MQFTLHLICTICTFVIMLDEHKLVAASPFPQDDARTINPSDVISSSIASTAAATTLLIEPVINSTDRNVDEDYLAPGKSASNINRIIEKAQRIIDNKRLLKNFVECLMDKGECTYEAQYLKSYLPEVFGKDCAKCTDPEKVYAGRILGHILLNYPNYWELILKKYDVTNNFRKNYEVSEEDYEDTEFEDAPDNY